MSNNEVCITHSTSELFLTASVSAPLVKREIRVGGAPRVYERPPAHHLPQVADRATASCRGTPTDHLTSNSTLVSLQVSEKLPCAHALPQSQRATHTGYLAITQCSDVEYLIHERLCNSKKDVCEEHTSCLPRRLARKAAGIQLGLFGGGNHVM